MNGKSLTACEQLSNRVLTIEQTRGVDRRAMEKYHMHSLVLMENAGLGCVQWLQRKFYGSRPKTVVLCGNGNNGGDGLVIARHLRVSGWPCEVVVCGPMERLSSDALANSKILAEQDAHGIRWYDESDAVWLAGQLKQAELIVDAVLGTGATGAPRAPYDQWIQAANRSEGLRVAIDIPTGVDAETGAMAEPAFSPHATLTFVARKPAMVRGDAKRVFGDLQVVPIGLPDMFLRRLVEDSSAASTVE